MEFSFSKITDHKYQWISCMFVVTVLIINQSIPAYCVVIWSITYEMTIAAKIAHLKFCKLESMLQQDFWLYSIQECEKQK